VRFAGQVERAIMVEDRGLLRGHRVFACAWDDVTEAGRDGRVFAGHSLD
jgi:hypothetical protein